MEEAIYDDKEHLNNLADQDAGMYQCKAGHLAVKKYLDKRKGENNNPQVKYFFDIEKCKCCPYRDGCYKVLKTAYYMSTFSKEYHLQ